MPPAAQALLLVAASASLLMAGWKSADVVCQLLRRCRLSTRCCCCSSPPTPGCWWPGRMAGRLPSCSLLKNRECQLQPTLRRTAGSCRPVRSRSSSGMRGVCGVSQSKHETVVRCSRDCDLCSFQSPPCAGRPRALGPFCPFLLMGPTACARPRRPSRLHRPPRPPPPCRLQP